MTGDIAQQINELSSRVVFVSAIALFLLVALAAFARSRFNRAQPPIFGLILFTVIVSTMTLLGSTIYLNSKSESGGPVHWQAGIEYWACGVQLDIRNPGGALSNRIGTPTLYEQDDQLIHIDGAVVNKQIDASLGKFMRVIGGDLSASRLSLPVAHNIIEDRVDGDSTDPTGASRVTNYTSEDQTGIVVTVGNTNTCDNKPAEVQTYVYSFSPNSNTYTQKKLIDPASYVINPEADVPKGDCIIVEFGPKRDRTDRLCESYGQHDDRRCVSFGIKAFDAVQCNIHEALPTIGAQK